MKRHGAVAGAAHARVADAHHIFDTVFEQLGRNRDHAPLGHAGGADGAGVLQHQDA